MLPPPSLSLSSFSLHLFFEFVLWYFTVSSCVPDLVFCGVLLASTQKLIKNRILLPNLKDCASGILRKQCRFAFSDVTLLRRSAKFFWHSIENVGRVSPGAESAILLFLINPSDGDPDCIHTWLESFWVITDNNHLLSRLLQRHTYNLAKSVNDGNRQG